MRSTILSWMALLLILATGEGCWAQSSAQLYGAVDLGVSSRRLSGEQRTTQLINGSLTTSFLGVRGSEDLGGGLSAQYTFESFLRADTGESGRSSTDPFWARASWVGLSAPPGTIRLGRMTTPAFLLGLRMDPFGSATGAPYHMHTYMPSATQPMMTSRGAADAMWSNAINVTTGAFSGVSFTGMAAAGEGSTSGRRWSAAVNYAAGPLAAGLVLERISRMSLPWGAPVPPLATPARPLFTASDMQSTHVGISYDFGSVKISAQGIRADLQNPGGSSIELTTSQLGALVRLGVGNVLVSLVHTDKNQAGASDLQRDSLGLGYQYYLSKRTDLYAVLLHDKVSGLTKGDSLVLGLRHTF